MKSILITGATGFVGRKLVKLLENYVYKISVLSRQQHPDYKTFVCDLAHEKIPTSVISSIDTIFHLAGLAHDQRISSKVEHLYRSINVDATFQLAKLAAQNGVKRFVFVSSVKAGGGAIVGRCMTEEDQGEPEGIYGRTKREAELKLLEIACQSGMRVSIIRSSLVYGTGVKGNLAKMRSWVEKGWFPPLPETGNRRSIIHVDDLVRALLLVAVDDRANGEIFIATDGVPQSSRKIYEAICKQLDKSVPSWSVPKFLFDGLASVSPWFRYKVEKLLGDGCYSSAKLESLGFRAECTLNDWE